MGWTKRLMSAAMCFSVVGVAAPGAVARSPLTSRVVFGGGLAIPTGPKDFSVGSSLGFGGTMGLEIRMAPPVRIVASVDYTTFGLDEGGYRTRHGIDSSTPVSGGEVAVLYAAAGLKIDVFLTAPSPVRPYLFGGIGYFRMHSDDLHVGATTLVQGPEEAFALHGGGGLDVMLGPAMNLFVEGLAEVGFTARQNTVYVPLRLGIAFALGGS